jgi:hydroxyacylglutathione hydrolase
MAPAAAQTGQFAVIDLPAVDDRLFPKNTRRAIARFWFWYWACFFLFLPWMVLRQACLSAREICGAVWTWNREIVLLDGALRIISMNTLASLAITALFGERFTAIQYEDVLVDPGPVFGRRRLMRYLRRSGATIHAVFATHAHEEHVGNVVPCSEMTGAPIYGSELTLNSVRQPETISWMRRAFIGQPLPAMQADLRSVDEILVTPRVRLMVIESPGHCAGHTSLFDAARGVLFAGDSFLHTIFTSPNKDVRGEEWIATLERYEALEIRTMVGTHGTVYSVDPGVSRRAFVVERTEPREMIRDKLAFLRWARDVVAEGERRRLPYSVIEACLFPWQRGWSCQNWFTDESGRLFSGGEFSRTHFVRSLSRTPEKVPPRFTIFVRWIRRVQGRSDGPFSGV